MHLFLEVLGNLHHSTPKKISLLAIEKKNHCVFALIFSSSKKLFFIFHATNSFKKISLNVYK